MYRSVKIAAIAATVALASLAGPVEAQVFYMSKNSNYNLADQAMRAGELDRASKLFRRAIRGSLSSETLLAAYNNLCAVDLARGDLEDAEKACTRAIGENRLYWRAYVNRGHVRAAMGKKELAVADIQKAIKLKPESKLAKRVLARVQQPNNLFAEANQ